MKIVGQISTPQEAKEMELVAKCLVVGNRARVLAAQIKQGMNIMNNEDNKKSKVKNKKNVPTEIPIIWVNIV